MKNVRQMYRLAERFESGLARSICTKANRRYGLLFFSIATLAVLLALLVLPPIPQDPAYHRFADQRVFLGIPNFLNVVSNIPLTLVGALGLWFLSRRPSEGFRPLFGEKREQWPCLAFYLGVALTGIGSAYYHLSPDNAHLFWDRLPMTIIFMSLVAMVICERISPKAGVLLLLPLLIAGGASVGYWYASEQSGAGDLRPYAFIHFYPVLLVLFILCLYPSRYTRSEDILGVLGLYALATIFESLDKQLFSLGSLVSGHTVKHLLASMAIWVHLRMLLKRSSREPANHPPA